MPKLTKHIPNKLEFNSIIEIFEYLIKSAKEDNNCIELFKLDTEDGRFELITILKKK